MKGGAGMLVASLEPRNGGEPKGPEQKLTFDAATRVWRGRESLRIDEIISEGMWPAEGKQPLGGQAVWLGVVWKPTPDGVFTRFHISDLWLDEKAMQRSAQLQTETHKALIRSRWMPGWVDAVDYGKFGRATVTATLFGGMDPSLYADFKKGTPAVMNGVESTLKHSGGAYGPAHMASRGSIADVIPWPGAVPLGSSGIRIRFETDLIIEGIRPGRIVRVQPGGWPVVNLPREEYVGDSSNPEDRFPTPSIFPKY